VGLASGVKQWEQSFDHSHGNRISDLLSDLSGIAVEAIGFWERLEQRSFSQRDRAMLFGVCKAPFCYVSAAGGEGWGNIVPAHPPVHV
jgi:hypothetical protein